MNGAGGGGGLKGWGGGGGGRLELKACGWVQTAVIQ